MRKRRQPSSWLNKLKSLSLPRSSSVVLFNSWRCCGVAESSLVRSKTCVWNWNCYLREGFQHSANILRREKLLSLESPESTRWNRRSFRFVLTQFMAEIELPPSPCCLSSSRDIKYLLIKRVKICFSCSLPWLTSHPTSERESCVCLCVVRWFPFDMKLKF